MPTTTTPDQELATALVGFQSDMPVVGKGKTADVGTYSYKYADLADVVEAARPVMAKHGLAFTCLPEQVEGGAYQLVGTLIHTAGGRIAGALPITGRSAQEMGSSLTYLRRYLFGCVTGIVTDDDDDGRRANATRERTTTDRRPAAAALWAMVQDTTNLDDVKGLWTTANGQGLLGTEIHHLDGGTETLGEAMRRYGDALTTPA